RTYIFPNGCLPSIQIMSECIGKRTNMRTLDLEDYGPHYAETLRQWRDNFNAHIDTLEALGYDERFRRLWMGYLAYCEAGFEERHIGLVHMVMAKPLYKVGVPITKQLAAQAS